MRLGLAVGLVILAAGGAVAHAEGACRNVEISFRPVKGLQIAVWIEDEHGGYVATAYVTRLTGTFGLGNRPGNHFLHSAPRFPYGRRDMVLPVWANKRNVRYGYVVMGGAAGNSRGQCGGDCDDDTIAYHPGVSSLEPFYCSPSGGMRKTVSGVDVVSCASTFIGSKGAYAGSGRFALYPPRADLTKFSSNDGDDAHGYAAANDLVAISQATPQLEQLVNPAIRWVPFADGNYVVKVELSQEGDFNAGFPDRHVNVDSIATFNNYGSNFLGQPSVVYAVPITVGPTPDEQTTSSYAGYGDWDGFSGALHPPDGTVADQPGSGAGRLLDVDDGGQHFRLRVRARPECGGPVCVPPSPPRNLTVTPHGTSVDVSFASASDGPATTRFDLRYRAMPISDGDFATALPPDLPPPPPGDQGATVTTSISGLQPDQTYYVAVRALSICEAPSLMLSVHTITTPQQFTTLHGCFIATAAYGSPLAGEIGVLRRLRDRTLLTSPLGRLAVGAYYALSPPVAAAIAGDERLRVGARALLAPLVRVAAAAEAASAAASAGR